ncbi:MAG TPA: hypothetical protein VFG69_00275, partial [Nannocystaceae bacterium]|nr:hypothetical protein [Nannocystaceae bacterium]
MPSRTAVSWLAALALVAGDASAGTKTRKAPAAAVVGGEREPTPRSQLTIAHARPMLGNVERQLSIELPLAPIDPVVRVLPAAVGLEIDVRAPVANVQAALANAIETAPEPWIVTARPVLGGTRARIVHRERNIAVAVGRAHGRVVVAFGALGEDARLRAFADAIRLPLPEPADLGADLEVWQDAERTVATGELAEA